MTSGSARTRPFLAALCDDDASDLRAIGRLRSHDAGDAIFHQGDDASGVHLLISGRVKITTTTAAGKEAILALRGPGDSVGELGAITHDTRSSAVRALELHAAGSVGHDPRTPAPCSRTSP